MIVSINVMSHNEMKVREVKYGFQDHRGQIQFFSLQYQFSCHSYLSTSILFPFLLSLCLFFSLFLVPNTVLWPRYTKCTTHYFYHKKRKTKYILCGKRAYKGLGQCCMIEAIIRWHYKREFLNLKE